MYLNSFNHFRAIAITFIVAGHCYTLSGIGFTSNLEKIIVNIITGGTTLFVFISGFLFHYIFYKKYQYTNFVLLKFKNVFLPYILLGALPVLLYTMKGTNDWGGFFYPSGNGYYDEYFLPAVKYYWTGRFLTAYWYVPFILVTFLLSPLHILFIKSRPKIQIFITILLCLVSVFMHRPIDNLFVFQSVVYFTPVYLIGILCSVYRDIVHSKLKGKELVLLAAILTLAIIQALVGVVGNYHKSPFEYGGLDIMFIQKILMSIFFMVFLARFESLNAEISNSMAATSFTIFFIHPFVLWEVNKYFGQYIATGSWVGFMFCVVAIIVICVTLAKIIKRTIPNYSRFIVGY